MENLENIKENLKNEISQILNKTSLALKIDEYAQRYSDNPEILTLLERLYSTRKQEIELLDDNLLLLKKNYKEDIHYYEY